MSTSIASIIFTFGQGPNTLSLTQFQSNQALVNMTVPSVIINNLGQFLTYIVSHANNSDISGPLCALLELGYQLIRVNNNDNAVFHEQMAIMVTDFSLNIGAYVSTISDEFNRRGFTLVVVGDSTPTQDIWNEYRTLALNTGGEFMLLQDAPGILERAILSTLHEGNTLRQAFYHMHQSNDPVVSSHIDVMNEHDQEMDGVGDFAFNHGLSQ